MPASRSTCPIRPPAHSVTSAAESSCSPPAIRHATLHRQVLGSPTAQLQGRDAIALRLATGALRRSRVAHGTPHVQRQDGVRLGARGVSGKHPSESLPFGQPPQVLVQRDHARQVDRWGKDVQPAPATDPARREPPYRYVPDSGPYGLFSPSNIIRKGRYYYALLQAERYNLQRRGACLIRTRQLADPKSWRAWDGNGFTVRFLNPYSPRLQDPAEHICKPVSYPKIAG